MNPTGVLSKNRRVSRRLVPRKGTKVTCQKGSLGLGPNLAVGVLDISESGVRLLLKAPLDVHQDVEVNLLGPGKGRPFKVLADVIWCVAAADGTFCVGARFQKALRFFDLQALCR